MRATGKNIKLSHSLKSFVKTRWNTVCEMFESFIAVFDEIRALLNARNDLITRFNKLNKSTLEEIHAFLDVFRSLTKELEQDQVATSVKILPAYEILIEHVKIKPNDSAIIKKMKLKGSQYIEENKHEVLPLNYELWAFFHPDYKRLQSFKSIDKAEVMVKIENAIEMVQLLRATGNDVDNNDTIAQSSNRSTAETENREKRKKPSLFINLRDDVESTDSFADEIQRYINCKSGKVDNLIESWYQNKDVYPLLFEYFLSFAAIPASSAAVERIFSSASNFITQRRSRLLPKNVEMLVFLHQNKKK